MVAGGKGLHGGSVSGLVAERRPGAAGCGADGVRCLARGGGSYQGLAGERVRVVDPLGGTVHVPGLARAPQGWDDLVVVHTAEQLGLSRVQSNTWGGPSRKTGVSEVTVPHRIPTVTSHSFSHHPS